MKRLIIFGGTGFIGSHLTDLLVSDYEIIIPSRNPEKHKETFKDKAKLIPIGNPETLARFFEGAYGIVNLTGENVGGRWTKTKKAAIYNSRIQSDSLICKTFELVKNLPKVVVQGSGMGVYGTETSDESVTEETPLGTEGFLTKIGIYHEQALAPLKGKTRIVFLRTGLVLDAKGGSLPQFLLPFRFFVGGPMGSGNQWLSWIAIDDEVRAIRFLLEKETANGPYNLTAPQPVRQKKMAKIIGKILHRPAFMPTPAFFLRLMMKEMANELILNGKKILPKRLSDEGFTFRFHNIEETLRAIL